MDFKQQVPDREHALDMSGSGGASSSGSGSVDDDENTEGATIIFPDANHQQQQVQDSSTATGTLTENHVLNEQGTEMMSTMLAEGPGQVPDNDDDDGDDDDDDDDEEDVGTARDERLGRRKDRDNLRHESRIYPTELRHRVINDPTMSCPGAYAVGGLHSSNTTSASTVTDTVSNQQQPMVEDTANTHTVENDDDGTSSEDAIQRRLREQDRLLREYQTQLQQIEASPAVQAILVEEASENVQAVPPQEAVRISSTIVVGIPMEPPGPSKLSQCWTYVRGIPRRTMIKIGVVLVLLGALSTAIPIIVENNKNKPCTAVWKPLGIPHTFESPSIPGDVLGQQVKLGHQARLSADGRTLALGAFKAATNEEGSVLVYTMLDNNQWHQVGNEIVGKSIRDGSWFGESIDLSSNGTVLAVGAMFHSGPAGVKSGFAGVYSLNEQENKWEQLGRELFGVNEGDRFGESVSLSADARVFSVAAPEHNNRTGQIRVYRYEDDVNDWMPLGSAIDGEADGNIAYFGYRQVLSSDASTLAAGAMFYDGGGLRSTGLVRVYRFQSGQWMQLGNDIIGDEIGDQLGKAVALSWDGNIVAVAAWLADDAGKNSGEVKVYQLVHGTEWIQMGEDIDGETSNDRAGCAVELSADGSVLAIGSRYHGSNDLNKNGQCRVLHYNGSSWKQVAEVIGSTSEDELGIDVSLSQDGKTMAAGAIGNENSKDTFLGYANVYKLPDCFDFD